MDVCGHDDRHGRFATDLLALAFEREAHRVGVRHIAHQGLQDGILQRRGAVAFEQPHQGRGDGAEIGASLAARMSRVWLAGAACARRSFALC